MGHIDVGRVIKAYLIWVKYLNYINKKILIGTRVVIRYCKLIPKETVMELDHDKLREHTRGVFVALD